MTAAELVARVLGEWGGEFTASRAEFFAAAAVRVIVEACMDIAAAEDEEASIWTRLRALAPEPPR